MYSEDEHKSQRSCGIPTYEYGYRKRQQLLDHRPDLADSVAVPLLHGQPMPPRTPDLTTNDHIRAAMSPRAERGTHTPHIQGIDPTDDYAGIHDRDFEDLVEAVSVVKTYPGETSSDMSFPDHYSAFRINSSTTSFSEEDDIEFMYKKVEEESPTPVWFTAEDYHNAPEDTDGRWSAPKSRSEHISLASCSGDVLERPQSEHGLGPLRQRSSARGIFRFAVNNDVGRSHGRTYSAMSTRSPSLDDAENGPEVKKTGPPPKKPKLVNPEGYDDLDWGTGGYASTGRPDDNYSTTREELRAATSKRVQDSSSFTSGVSALSAALSRRLRPTSPVPKTKSNNDDLRRSTRCLRKSSHVIHHERDIAASHDSVKPGIGRCSVRSPNFDSPSRPQISPAPSHPYGSGNITPDGTTTPDSKDTTTPGTSFTEPRRQPSRKDVRKVPTPPSGRCPSRKSEKELDLAGRRVPQQEPGSSKVEKGASAGLTRINLDRRRQNRLVSQHTDRISQDKAVQVKITRPNKRLIVCSLISGALAIAVVTVVLFSILS